MFAESSQTPQKHVRTDKTLSKQLFVSPDKLMIKFNYGLFLMFSAHKVCGFRFTHKYKVISNDSLQVPDITKFVTTELHTELIKSKN